MKYKLSQASALPPFEEIALVWNRAFGPEFPLHEKLWRQNTLGTPGFRPFDLILAHADDGHLIGFVLLRRFRALADYPGKRLESYANTGYIVALAVDPAFQRQGVGRALLVEAAMSLAGEGVETIRLGGSIRHFFPGLPDGYEAARRLFESVGHHFDYTKPEVDLTGPLDPARFEPILARAEATGLIYRQGRPGDEEAILSFLAGSFPGRWWYEVGLFLEQGGQVEDISLVQDTDGNIQGFLMSYWAGSAVLGPGVYWRVGQPEWGGIGPLGIGEALRGQGAGLALVAAGMRHLYERGARWARIDWTTLVDFYGRLGFQPVQTYWTDG